MFQTRSHFLPTWFFFSSRQTQRFCPLDQKSPISHCQSPAVTWFWLHLCAAHARAERLSARGGQDASPGRGVPAALRPGGRQWTVPLFHRTLQHGLGRGELNQNPHSAHLYHSQRRLCTQTVNTRSVTSPVLSHTDTGLGLGCMDPVHVYL